MRRVAGLALGLAVVTSGCLNMNPFKRADRTVALAPGPRVGQPAPELAGEDFDGQRFKLSEYRGKVVVVSFWNST
jgi:cytochrome oxidase Cu insertion factor (SCO1/SenC/PrrC family)